MTVVNCLPPRLMMQQYHFSSIREFISQNEIAAAAESRAKMISEMQGQQDCFDIQMAQAVLAASDQQTLFDSHMANHVARSALDASNQQNIFDRRMACAELSALDRQASFDSQMATATLEAGIMREAFEQLKCENALQKKAAEQVGSK